METHILLSIFVFFLPLLLLFFLFRSSKPKNNKNKKIGYVEFIGNINRMVDWSANLLLASPTGVVVTPLTVFIANPDAIRHVTKTHFEKYAIPDWTIHAFHDFLGDGVINANGDRWSTQRKALIHEMSARRFRCFSTESVRDGMENKLIPFLRRASKDSRVLDFQDVMERFAVDRTCKTMLDMDLGLLGLEGDDREGATFARAIEDVVRFSLGRCWQGPEIVWRTMRFLGVSSEKKLKESLKVANDRVFKCIRAKRQQILERINNDLLSTIMFDNKQESDVYFRDIAMNLVFAGRDTTSTALTWFFWILSTRPEVEDKILEEIISIRRKHGSLAGEAFMQEELSEMNYLQASLSEAMRLYPPVPFLGTSCIEDDVLPDGTLMKKGTDILYNSFAMGRMEKLWGKDCNKFMPERWLDDDAIFRPIDNYIYPVFHAGPRACLGKDYAYKTMKMVVAMMIERFEVVVLEKEKAPAYVVVVTLHMVDGLPVKVKEREIHTAWPTTIEANI